MRTRISVLIFLNLAFATTGSSALAQETNPYQSFKLPPLEVSSEFPDRVKAIVTVEALLPRCCRLEANGSPANPMRSYSGDIQ
jgi:hypothetical protein